MGRSSAILKMLRVGVELTHLKQICPATLRYIRAVSKHPPNLKIKRAIVVVDDAGVKRTVCESCGGRKYIAEGQTACDECNSHGGKIRAQRKRKVKS